MLDRALRPVKDATFRPLSWPIPSFVSPNFITCLGFISGITSCYYAAQLNPPYSLGFWTANRMLDCLDGALARRRQRLTDLGAFLDPLCDFIIYSLLPIAIAYGATMQEERLVLHREWWTKTKYIRAKTPPSFWFSIVALEASFHINNFIVFFIAAMLEKWRGMRTSDVASRLTRAASRSTLIESFETSILLGLMIWYPQRLELYCWFMASLVGVGILQRVLWVTLALSPGVSIEKDQ